MSRIDLVLLLGSIGAVVGCGKVDQTKPVDASTTHDSSQVFEDSPSATGLLTITPTGSGTITSTPAGIDCGATCSYSFAIGEMVTLTAAPTNGTTFTGWNGGGCSGTDACTVMVA